MIQTVFVAGAGTMGLDIAQVFARSGRNVWVRDISEQIIETAKSRLSGSYAKLASKGKLTSAEAEAQQGRIHFTVATQPAAEADLVVEAIVERIDLKKSVFKELDAICKPACIFASNTSSVSITEMAIASGRPDRFLGMHFFNPATVMKLVELIRALTTSEETYLTARGLCEELGKDPVEVQDSPGFVVNRILAPMMNEAAFLLEEHVASAEDIDKALRLGANHPMGPLQLADLVGLDVLVAIMDVLYSETHDPKFRACFLLRKMVRAGTLGRKTGQGFYNYR